ncbi:neuroblastoma breakpoint family member 11 isoform c, partial [Daubentonia madagascariensis]
TTHFRIHCLLPGQSAAEI